MTCGVFPRIEIKFVPTLANVSGETRRIPNHQGKVRHATSNHSTCTHHRVTANLNATKDCRIGADAGALVHQRSNWWFEDLASWIQVISEHTIGSKEGSILDRDPFPQSDSIFDHHMVPDDHSRLDVTLFAHIAVPAKMSPLHHVAESPYTSTRADRIGLNDRLRMDKDLIATHLASPAGLASSSRAAYIVCPPSAKRRDAASNTRTTSRARMPSLNGAFPD